MTRLVHIPVLQVICILTRPNRPESDVVRGGGGGGSGGGSEGGGGGGGGMTDCPCV